jgi:putative inorganic carbon (HCO3(-)) transporter
MLRSLLMLIVYMSFLGVSMAVPYVATLGYVWVDIFQPQTASYVLLNTLPVAMIMGAAAFGTYVLMDRRSPPPLTGILVLQLMFAAWVTLTTIYAVAGPVAWDKWSWAFKTIVFSAFVPFVIRSRVQIEALIQVYTLSMAANFIPFGAKVLLSGGGYGVNLGLQSGNGGLAEGGLLSTACLMVIPWLLHLANHTRLVPRWKVVPFAYWGMAGLAIATAMGTYERSALVGMGVLAIHTWVRSKRKLLLGVVIVCVGLGIAYKASSGYAARMSTIEDYSSEESAYVRILMWKWTLGFVASHPAGGGFQAYVTSVIDVPQLGNGSAHEEFGRAYHSSYFEVLGEEGFPGTAMFLGIVGLVLFRLRRLAREAREDPEFAWVASLANATEGGLAVFFSSGAFVSLSFQPMLWYFVAVPVCLNAYMWHARRQVAPTNQRWRASGPPQIDDSSPLVSWRSRQNTTVSRTVLKRG